MDPIITGALLGGAAGKFVEKTWDFGEAWISEYYKGHGKEAAEKARKNGLIFLQKLVESVELVQNNSKGDSITVELINTSFKDPDFYALLQKAIVTSARTASEDKHKILARLVTERLLTKSESMVSLVSNVAVETMQSLTSKHLNVLGLSVSLDAIRPMGLPESLNLEQRNKVASDWIIQNVYPFVQKVEELKYIDLRHLVSANCIIYQTFLGKNIVEVLKIGFGEWDVEKFLAQSEDGERLKKYYENNLQKVTLTSVGELIGIYVKDQITPGFQTKINWD